MKFTLFLFQILSPIALFSQVLQGFSSSEGYGSTQAAISNQTIGNLFLQPSVPLRKCGLFALFSSCIPTNTSFSKEFQVIVNKQNSGGSYRIGLVQSGGSLLRRQNLMLGLSKKILPEFFMGIDLLYLHSGIPEYEAKNFPGSQLSFFYQIKPSLQIATKLGFIHRLNKSEYLSNFYQLNLAWSPVQSFSLNMMSKKDPEWKVSDQSFALRFKSESSFYIDASSYINRHEFGFGTGFKLKNVDFNFSASWRQYWGVQLACALQYSWEAGSK